jgi:hypothetical protein
MPEWWNRLTRTSQKRLLERACGFESRFRHRYRSFSPLLRAIMDNAAEPKWLVMRRRTRVTSDHIVRPMIAHDHEDFFHGEGYSSYNCKNAS